MYVHDDITWEQFQQKFREAFSRDMTSDEHLWFRTVWTVVNSKTKEKSSAAAA